jgi:MoxR-like ATPase
MKRQAGDMAYTFPRPDHYVYPKDGTSGQKVERVARAIKYRRNTFIYGPAGSGKSAIIRALCHDLNLEASHYPMREGLDTELYIGQMAVEIDEKTGNNITTFKKGKMLEDLEGRVGADGVLRGVVILLDDIDRAPATYHEVLRHCLEDNAKNIFVPELGINVQLHPDTMIVATANSAGRGDTTGYYSSVEEMDESILDRFQRVVEFEFMAQDQELAILRRKFPLVVDKAGEDALNLVMKVAGVMRAMIDGDEIYASFSHRRIVQWLQSLEELILENEGRYEHAMLKQSAQDWLDWLDTNTRQNVIGRAINLITG